jgi:ATP-dependent Clp protease ATP-binding subunit ClpC
MAERELQIELSEETKEFLVDKGWDPAMGARPLRRAIQRYIEDPLADEVLKTPMQAGSTVLVERDAEQKQKAEAGEAEEQLRITILPPVQPPPAEQPVPVGGPEGDGGDEGANEPASEPPAEPEASAEQ